MSDQAQSLLERFAQAEADQALLQVMWQAISDEKNMSMMDGPISRSIMRAEREAAAIKQEYEQGVTP